MDIHTFMFSLWISMPSWIVVLIFIIIKSIQDKSKGNSNEKWKRIIIGSLATVPLTIVIILFYTLKILYPDGNTVAFSLIFYFINVIPLTLIYVVILWFIEKCIDQVKKLKVLN
ncbi:hypothetical protein X953_05925 [Virgibacillus sp. SK37]|nr:hypothetical protein X953_05925 [Virgibacillus sp. SK37]